MKGPPWLAANSSASLRTAGRVSIERLTAALADRYTMEREHGAGGMATVYLAEDLRHHRRMAIAEIFYRADGEFKVADVAAEPALHVTANGDFMNGTYRPQPAAHANYDVSPDGTRLLVLQGNRQRLLVVHGRGTEARARLRAGAPGQQRRTP
jgi:hypothetical protein